jgi:hypothetical protein
MLPRTKKGFANAPVELRYVDSMRQRKDGESRRLKDIIGHRRPLAIRNLSTDGVDVGIDEEKADLRLNRWRIIGWLTSRWRITGQLRYSSCFACDVSFQASWFTNTTSCKGFTKIRAMH